MDMQPAIEETGGLNTSGDLNDPAVLLTLHKAFCEVTDTPPSVTPDVYYGKERDYGDKN